MPRPVFDKTKSSINPARVNQSLCMLAWSISTVLFPAFAWADYYIDSDAARALHASGAILSLEHFTHKARTLHPGRVINAKLLYEDSHQSHVYEIEILDPRGEVWEYEFDAHSGMLIERERSGD